MIKIILPSYIVSENEIKEKESINESVIYVENNNNVEECLKKAKEVAPETFSNLYDDNNRLKKSCIVVHNEKIVNKERLEELVINEHDTIEILIQLAGG